MAVSAPLPEYPYEAKHANVTWKRCLRHDCRYCERKGHECDDGAKHGNAILDKVTTETFRRWRFKPGTVSQVRYRSAMNEMEFTRCEEKDNVPDISARRCRDGQIM